MALSWNILILIFALLAAAVIGLVLLAAVIIGIILIVKSSKNKKQEVD